MARLVPVTLEEVTGGKWGALWRAPRRADGRARHGGRSAWENARLFMCLCLRLATGHGGRKLSLGGGRGHAGMSRPGAAPGASEHHSCAPSVPPSHHETSSCRVLREKQTQSHTEEDFPMFDERVFRSHGFSSLCCVFSFYSGRVPSAPRTAWRRLGPAP